MKGFVMRLVALSALWALCDLLLGEGRNKDGVRFVMGLMVMLSLLAGVSGILPKKETAPASAVLFAQNRAENSSKKHALQSRCNQIRDLVLILADRAGYNAEAAVVLSMQGQMERIDLSLWRKEGITPLISGGELKEKILLLLGITEKQINLTAEN